MVKFVADGSVASAPSAVNITAVGGPNMSDASVMQSVDKPQLESSLPGEVWKQVPSEPGVLASNMGRVLQSPRYAPMRNGGYRGYFPKPRYGEIARAKKDAKHSYRHVMVYRDGQSRQSPRKVHQLVCEAFNGPKPFDSAVVIHLDEDAHNNRPENLIWGTQKDNLSTYRTYTDRATTKQGGQG